jgi:hypothetical protein
MNILLDPYILALPEEPSRAEAYLDALSTWTEVIGNGQSQHHVWLSQVMLSALWDTHLYPTWDSLTALEVHLPDSKAYNVHTLFRACEAQLTTPPLLDDLLSNSTHYYENDQVVVIPEAIAHRLPEPVAVALRETLALAALGYTLLAHEAFVSLVFGTTVEAGEERSLHIDFNAQDIRTEQMTVVRHCWDIITSPDALDDDNALTDPDLCDFWRDTARAVASLYKLVYGSSSVAPPCPVVIAHALFNQQVAEFNLDKQPALLSKLFRQLVKGATGMMPRRTKYHHPLYYNGKALRKQDASAWRLWVESSTPGWRLHYWLYTDGCIELASFVKHDDYSITDPSR